MTKILFFDTETTGFPNNRSLDEQPNIVQLAGMMYEHSEDPLLVHDGENFDELFKSILPIEQRLTDIHGISNEMVENKPMLCESKFITDFMKMMKESDIIVGHNVDFDIKMIFIEIERALQHLPEKLKELKQFRIECTKKSVCTMAFSTNLCKLPGRYGEYKWPKLQELHKFLFGDEFESAHNALNDILATKRCFFELVERDIIKLPLLKT